MQWNLLFESVETHLFSNSCTVNCFYIDCEKKPHVIGFQLKIMHLSLNIGWYWVNYFPTTQNIVQTKKFGYVIFKMRFSKKKSEYLMNILSRNNCWIWLEFIPVWIFQSSASFCIYKLAHNWACIFMGSNVMLHFINTLCNNAG